MGQSHKRMTGMRVALRALVWLVVGAVVSVGVAWGLELWEPGPGRYLHLARKSWAPDLGLIDSDTTPIELPQLDEARRVALVEWGNPPRSVPRDRPSNYFQFFGTGRDERCLRVLYHYASETSGWYERNYVWCRAGWPVRCLGCAGMCAGPVPEPAIIASYAGLTVPSPAWRGGVPAPDCLRPRGNPWAAAFGSSPRPIPFRPLWRGLALDSVFYGGALWLLLAFPFALRRVVRKRRGRCTACGYNLAGLAGEVCPECGREKPRPGDVPR